MHHSSLSKQEAMYAIDIWYNDQIEQFIVAMMNLPDCPDKTTRARVKEYVWGLANCVTANYEWSLDNVRYNIQEEIDNEPGSFGISVQTKL